MKKVGIVMGSDSDLPVIRKATDTLRALGIPFEAHVYSAHRTPDEAMAFARSAKENGFGVIIAAAGMAAHLAGAIAANTTLPVIGIVVFKRKPVRPGEQPDAIPRGRQLVLAGAFSLVIGLYDGLYGPGTGTFLLMVYTGLCKMSLERASGTVKLVNLSSNVTSLVLFLVKGQVLVLLGVISGGFCLLGHFIGSGMMMKNGSKIVRPVIIVVLVLLFIKVISDMAG